MAHAAVPGLPNLPSVTTVSRRAGALASVVSQQREGAWLTVFPYNHLASHSHGRSSHHTNQHTAILMQHSKCVSSADFLLIGKGFASFDSKPKVPHKKLSSSRNSSQ